MIVCFFVKITLAQNIKVIDSKGIPVNEALVCNADGTVNVMTNANGIFDVSLFYPGIIYIAHPVYNPEIRDSKVLVEQHISSIEVKFNCESLEQIIISTSKFEQQQKDLTQKVLSINANDILLANSQTSADILENTGQVSVQKSQLGGGSPIIRGFSANRLLINVDGVRMNTAIFRSGNLQNVISIDPFSIENTEVILGASSVLYGSDAIGGVMSFYTQKPKLSYGDSLQVNSNIFARHATASRERTGHIDFNIGLKRWGFVTNATYTNFGDLKMGKHGPSDYLRNTYIITENKKDSTVQNINPLIQRFSGYKQYNLMHKIAFEPHENLNFSLGLFYTTTSNIPRYDRLIQHRDDALRFAQWDYGPQQWFMSNLKTTLKNSKSVFFDDLKINVAYQNFKESRIDRRFQDVIQRTRKERVNAYSCNADFKKKINNLAELYYGLDYVYNKVGSSGSIRNTFTDRDTLSLSRYPNGATWQSAAAYTSLSYELTPDLKLQSGLRFNTVISKANFEENNTFLNLPFTEAQNTSHAITGTLGFNWFPNRVMQWKLNLGTAFRAPNIDDIGKVFDSEPGAVIVPNDGLKPEYAYNGELGVLLNFDDIITIDMAGYYTLLEDALVRQDFNLNGETEIFYDGELSRVQAIQNASKSRIYGFEAGVHISVSPRVKLTSQYTITKGEELFNGASFPVRHVAPFFGNTHFIYSHDICDVDIFANYNKGFSFDELAPSEIAKRHLYAIDRNGNPYSPSWYTINIRTKFNIAPGMVLTTGLENITNQRYRTYSSGIAAAGRNVILALKYKL